MTSGNYLNAEQCFQRVKDDPNADQKLVQFANKYLQICSDLASSYIEVTATQGLNMTKTLSAGKTSMLQTSALGKTAQIGITEKRRESLVAVLDQNFPTGSAQRIGLIKQFSQDVSTALDTVTKHRVLGVKPGSVIIEFEFEDPTESIELGQRYLEQVKDSGSALFRGKVTKDLNSKRTLASMSARTKLIAGSSLHIAALWQCRGICTCNASWDETRERYI